MASTLAETPVTSSVPTEFAGGHRCLEDHLELQKGGVLPTNSAEICPAQSASFGWSLIKNFWNWLR